MQMLRTLGAIYQSQFYCSIKKFVSYSFIKTFEETGKSMCVVLVTVCSIAKYEGSTLANLVITISVKL